MDHGRYKWVALSNTTFGVLLATIDATIVLVAMPDIFRGIHLDPLAPGNSFYLLWMVLGFLVVTSVLVVSLGRLGDLYGRVRMYKLGLAIYTLASLLLAIDWMHGTAGADWLIAFRVFQGVGAAFLIGNSVAILTDAFPPHQRGLALGLNNVVGISGQFVGLVLGGVLAPIDWRLIFVVSVPLGIVGMVWSHFKLREIGVRDDAPVDWAGNATFAIGLVLVMIGVTYGIRPYGNSTMGWGSPFVVGSLVSGVLVLLAFVRLESRVRHPMFAIQLFRIRAFTTGVLANFLCSLARGGLMFMLIIWLQGIWLPEHGYSFATTPMWAGIYMLPQTAGFLLAGPVSGILSDRFGARGFSTAGMLGIATTFALLILLPTNFAYPEFAAVLLFGGLSMGAFAAPNRSSVMNSLPARHRGAGSGMMVTFQNSAQVLSIGVFFTLLIVGLASRLPTALANGLIAHGVPPATAHHVATVPPVSVVFSAFLGYNPLHVLLGAHGLAHLSAANAHVLNGQHFFPALLAPSFRVGLHYAFLFAIFACLAGAAASWLRGQRPAVATAEAPATNEPIDALA